MVTPDIPDNVYASEQVVNAWDRIAKVHHMYHDQSISKQGLLLHGESGLGKTFILKQYCKSSPSFFTGETHTVPVLYLAINRTTRTIDEIPHLLITALGAPLPVKKPTSICLEKQLVHMLHEKRVELIMLDEIQNLNTSYDGLEFQKIIKYLCYLLDRDDIKCSIVFAGSDFAKRIMSFGETNKKLPDGEHLSRRLLRPIHLTRCKPKSEQWVECVNWFIQSVALPMLDHRKHQDFMNRLYLCYNDRAMSSLRDLFSQPNSRQAKTIEQLKDAMFENFEIYGKSEINPFCEEDLSNEDALNANNNLLSKMQMTASRKRTQALATFV